MKIREILKENKSPIEYIMILNEIIKNGKTTNSVHSILLANLIDFYRNSICGKFPNLLNTAAPKDILDSVKMLHPDDSVFLAKFFLNVLNTPDKSVFCNQFNDPALNTLDWVSLVLRVQK